MALEAGGSKVGASVAQPEFGNVSRILLILSQKNKQTFLRGFYLSYKQVE